MATQTKKKRSRRHDARISRQAIRSTKLMIFRGAFAPRTPLHAHSLAASPARSVRVAHSLRSFALSDDPSDDPAVAQRDRLVRLLRELGVVGHEHDRGL